ncbi:hypothetical protein [Streptomyces sp. XD-27]|uniref:hypothetical protein n=1 Tax=Streptomyces sp. XD-27 TaxID=3062779 RepID=UPI0026F44583|nr:hypothetical protein [Streptomyces sp. XD-27]WKX72432.1 hypothetical protein Q3Y56_23255 [Streptomyces sp. XD-27]
MRGRHTALAACHERPSLAGRNSVLGLACRSGVLPRTDRLRAIGSGHRLRPAAGSRVGRGCRVQCGVRDVHRANRGRTPLGAAFRTRGGSSVMRDAVTGGHGVLRSGATGAMGTAVRGIGPLRVGGVGA